MQDLKCKHCKADFVKKNNKVNHVKFCSVECRNLDYRERPEYKEKVQKYNDLRQERKTCNVQGKQPCVICGKFYLLPTYHAQSRHKVSAKDYKKMIGADINKAVAPEWWREGKREQAMEHYETITRVLNKYGKPYRYKAGDKTIGRYERSPETMARLRRHILTIGKGRKTKK